MCIDLEKGENNQYNKKADWNSLVEMKKLLSLFFIYTAILPRKRQFAQEDNH